MKKTELDKQKILHNLHRFYTSISIFDEVTSTNTLLKQKENLKEGDIFIANAQTSGKGRNGKFFESNADCGIYLSFCVQPDTSLNFLHLSAYAALAVYDSIVDLYEIQSSIKWMNDIYIHHKKVCGILCESNFIGQRLSSVIIGIGVNMYTQQFRDDLQDFVGSIENFSDKHVDRNMMATTILNNFQKYYQETSPKIALAHYKRHSSVLHNHIIIDGEALSNVYVEDISDDFELYVRLPDNTHRTLRSGSIHIQKKDF
ncbi:MAG: biotin--[acetyl-CoA-carboxylase] ligase [Breznakia sp.]